MTGSTRTAPLESSKRIIDEAPSSHRFVEIANVHVYPNHVCQVKPMRVDFLAAHLART